MTDEEFAAILSTRAVRLEGRKLIVDQRELAPLVNAYREHTVRFLRNGIAYQENRRSTGKLSVEEAGHLEIHYYRLFATAMQLDLSEGIKTYGDELLPLVNRFPEIIGK